MHCTPSLYELTYVSEQFITDQRGFPSLFLTNGRGFHLNVSVNHTATYTCCGELHPPHDGGWENSLNSVCVPLTPRTASQFRPKLTTAPASHNIPPFTLYIQQYHVMVHNSLRGGDGGLRVVLSYRQYLVVHTAVHHDSTRLLLTKFTRHV